MQAPAYDAALEVLDWQGQLQWSPRQAVPAAAGRLELSGLSLVDRSSAVTLVALGQVRGEGLRLAGDASSAWRRLQLQRGSFLATAEVAPLVTLGHLLIEEYDRPAAGGISLAAVEAQDLQLALTRAADGAWPVIDQLGGQADPAPAETGADHAAPPPVPLRVQRLRIAGNSRLSLVDHSVQPPFWRDLELRRLEITDLDSARPDQALALTVEAAAGGYSEIFAEGRLKAFAEPPAGSLSGRLRQVELQLADGRIEGETRFTLAGLHLDPSDTDKMQALTKRLSMPLPAALDLLRRGDGSIQLQVPVQGAIDDPRFDLGDAINQALGSALKKGVFAYLKHTLQPYVTLISLAQLAGDAVTRVRLDPIRYAPGSAALDAEASAYLDKILALLEQRPDLKLRLCPRYTPADVRALTPPAPAPATTTGAAVAAPVEAQADPEARAGELATQRAVNLKAEPVERRGVAPHRLQLCLPAADAAAGAVARVDLLI